ncbi:MAG TPA: hypothetical protein VD997_03940 [Phycisphaerales bacterium]|nr:hypothetical protein [Phycisphaerales bacterium]
MQITTSTQPVLTQPMQQPLTPAPAPASTNQTPIQPAPAPVDTVEVSEEATNAAAGRTNKQGKATGHARVAQNIEKNVAKMIERETARVVAAGGDAASVDAFKTQVEGLAAAYTADPSTPPARVLSQIKDALAGFRARETETPTAPTDGEVVPPTDTEVPAVDGEITPNTGPLPTPAPAPTPAPTDVLPAPDEPIVADLSGLRLL